VDKGWDFRVRARVGHGEPPQPLYGGGLTTSHGRPAQDTLNPKP
jgi:hypothetical protein